MKTPLISIITVSYNAATTIEQTILSVINQTYPNIEYIIIDGGSTDGTIDIIKKYVDKISYWISEPDKGIYDAMNKGIKIASGEWINFMNCGDSFYNNTVLEDVFKIADFSSDVIYGNTNKILNLGEYILKASDVTGNNYMPFSHQAAFSRTSLMKKYGFDIEFKICADKKFFFEVLKGGYKFEYTDKVIANYEAENGFSASNTLNLLYEIGLIEGKTNDVLWIVNFTRYAIWFKLKQLIKVILPEKIVSLIKRHNIRCKANENRIHY